MDGGVKQGSPLSPGLFNLLIADLEEYMRKERWGGVKLKDGRVYMLAYADDLVLLVEEEKGMRAMMTKLERYIRQKWLTVNVGKSKMLRFGKRGGRRRRIRWYWEGREVEEVRSFKYLGYVFQKNEEQDTQIRDRIKTAVMGQVWRIGKRRFGGD